MENKRAFGIARWFVNSFQPGCERVAVAGSIRRGKPDVNDIEIVARPILKAPRPVFGQKVLFSTPLDQILYELIQNGKLIKIKGGEKYKQFWIMDGEIHVIKLDLFLVTPPAQWGVQMVIRTGPNKTDNNFSQWMVTEKSKGGALPNGYIVKEGVVGEKIALNAMGKTGRKGEIEMPEEEDFFRFCGLDWIEPSKRVAGWKR